VSAAARGGRANVGAGGALPTAAAVARIRRALLRWYTANKRALPWRDDPDPYRVLVSEIMLQQTTVEAVRPRFDTFLARFPSVAALAAASEDEVLAAWSGLGYYERARNLRRAAIAIVREWGGAVPDAAAALARLPGVGRYTAGAVASIAFGRREPVLDGNVARLLSRLYCVGGDPRAAATRARLWALAARLVPPRDASSFNQGMMEIGALVCRPRDPACEACPLGGACEARAGGVVARYPQRAARARTAFVVAAAAVVRDRRGRVLLRRRARAGAMRGLWELPSAEVRVADSAAAIEERLREETGLAFSIGRLLATARHTVMHRKIELRAFRARVARRRVRPGASAPGATRGAAHAGTTPDVTWVAPADLAHYPHSSLLEKVLAQVRGRSQHAC
jgi:A/G-specific adenine glycosylase